MISIIGGIAFGWMWIRQCCWILAQQCSPTSALLNKSAVQGLSGWAVLYQCPSILFEAIHSRAEAHTHTRCTRTGYSILIPAFYWQSSCFVRRRRGLTLCWESWMKRLEAPEFTVCRCYGEPFRFLWFWKSILFGGKEKLSHRVCW